jgi:hypothetical protein
MKSDTLNLQPGNMIRVRSKAEIEKTLEQRNQLRGCTFTEEMWSYCDTKQRVLKRVKQFLEEHDYLVKKCTDVVLLEGVLCKGTKDYPDCDRSCFLFWREEWLEKVEP